MNLRKRTAKFAVTFDDCANIVDSKSTYFFSWNESSVFGLYLVDFEKLQSRLNYPEDLEKNVL